MLYSCSAFDLRKYFCSGNSSVFLATLSGTSTNCFWLLYTAKHWPLWKYVGIDFFVVQTYVRIKTSEKEKHTSHTSHTLYTWQLDSYYPMNQKLVVLSPTVILDTKSLIEQTLVNWRYSSKLWKLVFGGKKLRT